MDNEFYSGFPGAEQLKNILMPYHCENVNLKLINELPAQTDPLHILPISFLVLWK